MIEDIVEKSGMITTATYKYSGHQLQIWITMAIMIFHSIIIFHQRKWLPIKNGALSNINLLYDEDTKPDLHRSSFDNVDGESGLNVMQRWVVQPIS